MGYRRSTAKAMTRSPLPGSRSDFIVSSSDITSAISTLKSYAPSLLAVEGPNEDNFWPVKYQGASNLPAAAAYQKALYAAVKSDTVLASTPVYNLTLGGVGKRAYAPLGDLSHAADYGNAHV